MAMPFQLIIRSPELRQDLSLVNGADFHLGDTDLDRIFQVSLPKRERDLLRIMMGIYIADRLVRRPRRAQDVTASREIEITVEVAYPDFWSDPHTLKLLYDITGHLSNDVWSFRFTAGYRIPEQLSLLPEAPVVCQYSAGLDSAAGLCSHLRETRSPILTVTASHQSFHGRLRDQVRLIGERYGARVRSVFCRTRLVNPPKFSMQESTQRLRAAIFMGLGGAVASAVKAESVEVFENGIGAINLPPQLGMMLGANCTHACQPNFLTAMARLLSWVAARSIRFNLPMLRATKAESARGLVHDGIEHVAGLTMSCVHWPLRNPGIAKQCGVCFACIGRRQALLAAGAPDPPAMYEIDLFGSHPSELYDGAKLMPLKACLMQVVDLRNLCETDTAPVGFDQHIRASGVLQVGLTRHEVVDLHRRYVSEWLSIIAKANDQKLPWARWIKRSGIAA